MPSPPEPIAEVCPRCRGFVWHRRYPCNCKPGKYVGNADPADYLLALGCRLRACRESKGLSLDGLAERVGLSKTGLWQIENGKSEPMATTLIALAVALDVSTDYLLLRY